MDVFNGMNSDINEVIRSEHHSEERAKEKGLHLVWGKMKCIIQHVLRSKQWRF